MTKTTTTSQSTPTEVRGLALSAICALLALVAFPALSFLGKPATQPPASVNVYDEAGILNDRQLIESISTIGFVKPVRISILTLPDLEGQSLNAKTLEYGRTAALKEPWISSSNPRYWAEQTLILALAPYERQVGTYFGEDIAVDFTIQSQIQEAMKDDLRAYRYDDAFYRGAQTSAGYMDTSVASSFMGQVGAGIVSLGGVAWFVTRAVNRVKSRRNLEEARRNYAQVSADFEATSIDAGLLDQSDVHGRKVYERYEEYVRGYHRLTRQFHDFGTLSFAHSLTGGAVKETNDLKEKAVALNAIDDGISNTAAFLTMSSRWPDVWRNETGPLYEDLDALEELVHDVQEVPEEMLSEVLDDAHDIRQRLAQMPEALEYGSLAPSEALNELDRMSNTLWRLSRQILEESMRASRAQGGNVGYDDVDDLFRGNTTGYSGHWRDSGGVQTYQPGSTIRANRGSSGGAGTSHGSYAPSSSSALAGLVVGYSTSPINPSYAVSSSSDSDSSSYSDFGGGGSSFSGSGSSSSY